MCVVLLFWESDKKILQCATISIEKQIVSANQFFTAQKYTQARNLYLEIAKEALAPQAQIFKTRAAYCLLFDGQCDESLKEFQDIADSYSDIYNPTAVGIVERFNKFNDRPLKIQKQIIYAERIRLGLITESDIRDIEIVRKTNTSVFSFKKFIWVPQWQEVAANAVLYAKSDQLEKTEKFILDSLASLSQEDVKKMLLDIFSDVCMNRTSPTLELYEKYFVLFDKMWTEANKNSSDDVKHSDLNAKYLYMKGLLMYQKIMLTSNDTNSDTLIPNMQDTCKLFEEALKTTKLPRMLQLGVDFRLLTLYRCHLPPNQTRQKLNELLKKYPSSAILPVAVLQTGIVLKNQENISDARECFDYIKEHFPDSNEINILSTNEFFNIPHVSLNRKVQPSFVLLMVINIIVISFIIIKIFINKSKHKKRNVL
jgi:tetratricopeptide (TPR) repeat protein